MRLSPAIAAVLLAAPLAAQDLPPYVPLNPALSSRSALYAQPIVSPKPGWQLRIVADYTNAIESATSTDSVTDSVSDTSSDTDTDSDTIDTDTTTDSDTGSAWFYTPPVGSVIGGGIVSSYDYRCRVTIGATVSATTQSVNYRALIGVGAVANQ